MSGQFILVCGEVGGAGRTTLAVNLATSLAMHRAGKVAVADAGTVYGDAALLAGAVPPLALAPLFRGPGAVDSLPTGYVSTVSSGVSFVTFGTAPIAPDARSGDLESALRLIGTLFDVIVFDVPAAALRHLPAITRVCDRALVVTSPTPIAMSRTRHFVRALRAMHVSPTGILVCVNRVSRTEQVTPREVEELCDARCAATLPADVSTFAALTTQGRTVVEGAPKHPWTRVVDGLARELIVSLRSSQPGSGAPAPATTDETTLRRRILRRLVDEVEITKGDVASFTDPVKLEELRANVEQTLVRLIAEEAAHLESRQQKQALLKVLIDEALGLGPLEDLLADPSVTEIMVNRHDQIYVERGGRLERTAVRFTSSDHVRGVIERIVSPLGRRIDEKVPLVDARLADGSRVNAIIPPLAIGGPALTIRKFSRRVLQANDLVEFGSLSPQMLMLLEAAVRARLNILIAGGTGSGKTTLLNVLSSFVPDNERIVTIEDAAELRLPQEHVVTLEARMANVEGEGSITIRDLVRNALRMRPDRIVVGECRGGEALDMLQAMNTGHDGSLTSVHANSPRDALGRIETLALMAGLDLPARAIRDQIVSAIQLVIQQGRLRDGSRRITQISEVVGMEGGEFVVRDLFAFKTLGTNPDGSIRGLFAPTGHVPTFFEALGSAGVQVPREIFIAQGA